MPGLINKPTLLRHSEYIAVTAGMKPFEQFTDDEFMRTYAVSALATISSALAIAPFMPWAPGVSVGSMN